MKKYIMPKTHCINLAGKETMLISGSINNTQEDVEVMTRNQESCSSPWDNWNE